MPPSWHPVPACTPRLRYRRAVLRCSSGSSRRAVLSCSSDGAAVIPKSGLEIKNRCSLWDGSGETHAVIPNSGPEIKNRCSLWDGSGENHAVIPKSGPEIKNHCTLEGVSWQKPAVIPKSELEFKNRCSRWEVAVCRRNHSLLRRRRLESDADLVAATAVASGTILLRGNGD